MATTFIRALDFDALPVFSISGTTRVVVNAQTGDASVEREPARYLLHNDAYYVNADGVVWEVFTDQDGTTWRQRGLWGRD